MRKRYNAQMSSKSRNFIHCCPVSCVGGRGSVVRWVYRKCWKCYSKERFFGKGHCTTDVDACAARTIPLPYIWSRSIRRRYQHSP